MSLSDSSSSPDSQEAILAQLLADLEKQGPKVIEDYKARYPHLAKEMDTVLGLHAAVADAVPEAETPVPPRLGEFSMIRQVASGGMGEIWEADQERLGRRVAVKIIRRGKVSPQTQERFLREQHVLARLHQTHIVAIHTAGEEGRLQYFAMPFIDGAALSHVVAAARQQYTGRRAKTPTLGELARQVAGAEDHEQKTILQDPLKPPADPEGGAKEEKSPSPGGPAAADPEVDGWRPSSVYLRSLAEVMAEVADAVQHAHDARVLHRDLKPSNIMVDQSGQSWIIDFGLARLRFEEAAQASQSPGGSEEGGLTRGPMGTPQYMAPEQYERHADERSDVWGLGVTLYELLTLKHAFDGTYEEIEKQVREGEAVRPRQVAGEVPADLEAICLKALQKEPAQRYGTAKEFGADLRRWLGWHPTVARPGRLYLRPLWLWARRNPWAMVAVVVMVLAVLAVGVGIVASEHQKAAMQSELDQKYRSLLQEVQHQRLTERNQGWFWKACRKLGDAAEIHQDDLLRDQITACLAGLDAVPEKEFDLEASSVAFDRDGKRLLLGGTNDQQTGKPLRGAQLWEGGVTDLPRPSRQGGEGPVTFATDGTPLQLLVKDRWTLRLYDMAGDRVQREFALGEKLPPEPVTSLTEIVLALSADGSRVAGSTDLPGGKGTLAVWDARTGQLLGRWDRKATALAFTPGGELLASGDKDGVVTIWSPKGEKPLATLGPVRPEVGAIAFGHDPRWPAKPPGHLEAWSLAVGHNGGEVVLWDLTTRLPSSFCRGSNYYITALAFSPDGMTLASGGHTWVKIWDRATGRSLLTIGGPTFLTGLAFSPQGKKLAFSGKEAFGNHYKSSIWNLENGRGAHTLRGLKTNVEKVVLSPDGHYLAALSQDWQLAVWNLGTGKLSLLRDMTSGNFVDNSGLALSPEGKLVAFSSDKQARLWEVESGQEQACWSLPPGINDNLAFDRTGKRLLLSRMETMKGLLPPVSEVSWKEHPRVLHLRDLLSANPTKPFQQITYFNRYGYGGSGTDDGSCLIFGGIR